METASDFASWAIPDLVIPLKCSDGELREFTVHPPSVGDMDKLLASVVLAEIKIGIAKGAVPPGVRAVLDTIKGEHPSLGIAYQKMVDGGVHPMTIDRMAYYCVFYWTRGKEYADSIAVLLWAREQEDAAEEATGPAPKG